MRIGSKEAKVFAEASEKYTNVPLLPSIIVALICGTVTIGVTWLLKGGIPYIHSLIHGRGGIQYLTVYCFWFAAGMLVFKWRMLRKEQSAFSLPYVKGFTAGRDVIGNKTILEQHVLIEENLDVEQQKLILVNRINKGIKQLKISNTPSEVANVLSTVSATDSAIIDSSYVPIKFMIWVIPVLGFIGTVIGMSKAIGSFNIVLQGIKDVGFQGMQAGLGKVTAGLAVAFDTTFLALVLSAFINLLTNMVQKREEDLLSDVEDFVTDNIVNKLSVVSAQSELAQQSPNWENLGSSLEGLLREFRNLSRQNQVNADGMQQQLGRVIEAVDNVKSQEGGEMPISMDGELPSALREFSQTLKENMESLKAMGELGQLVKGSADVIESLKGPIEEMAAVNKKLGELYGKIYKTDF